MIVYDTKSATFSSKINTGSFRIFYLVASWYKLELIKFWCIPLCTGILKESMHRMIIVLACKALQFNNTLEFSSEYFIFTKLVSQKVGKLRNKFSPFGLEKTTLD